GEVVLLATGLGDKDAQVRRAAAKVLGANRGVQAAVTTLRDSSTQLPQAAALGSGYAQRTSVIDALVGALGDPDSDVRACAAGGVKALAWTATTDEEQALFDVATGNARAAGLRGDAALKSLLLELQHRFGSQRRAAAEALAAVKDRKRIKPLLSATRDEDTSVRVWAAH